MSGETYYPLAKRDPQAVGSAMTYGRRYGLMAILGVVTDDDDGQAGSQTRGLANNAPANDKWNTKPPANPPAQAKPALASKPEPAKPQEPAKDYLGTGTEAKKKEKKFKDLCTALNKAGDSNDGNKWNSEVLNDFTLAFHGKGLADCDKAEILAIIDALEERLEEREAMSAQDESEPKPVQEKTTGTEPMITDAQTNGITRMCDIKDKHMPDIVSEFTGQRTEVLAEMTEAEAATALKAMMKM